MKFKVTGDTLNHFGGWGFDPEYEFELEGEPIQTSPAKEKPWFCKKHSCGGNSGSCWVCKKSSREKLFIEKLDLPSTERNNWESADIRDKINELVTAINELRATPTNLE